MRQMHALRRHRLGEQGVQFAAVEDIVRRAELRFDLLAERRAGQRAAVLPAALMEERRAARRPWRTPRRARAGSGAREHSG